MSIAVTEETSAWSSTPDPRGDLQRLQAQWSNAKWWQPVYARRCPWVSPGWINGRPKSFRRRRELVAFRRLRLVEMGYRAKGWTNWGQSHGT